MSSMRRHQLSLSVLAFVLCVSCTQTPIDTAIKGITRGDNATLRIEWQGKVFYVDPIGTIPSERVDAVFISHRHSDHYDPVALSTFNPTVPIYAPFDAKNITRLPVGQKIVVAGIEIEAVPSYNIEKKQYHPQKDGNAGYIFTLDHIRLYVAGDTERIPEMKDIICDIAIVPLGQKHTMRSIDDAVESVLDTKASIGIPTHYGFAEGTDSDAISFVEKLAKRGSRGFIAPPLKKK